MADMKTDFQKTKYLSNPEVKEQCKKRYQENPELHLKKSCNRNFKKRKVVIRLIIFLDNFLSDSHLRVLSSSEII